MIRQGFWAGLIGTAFWFVAPAETSAQQSCSTQDGVYTCSIAAGSYSSEVSIAAPNNNGFSAAAPISVTSAGDITSQASSSSASALNVFALGASDVTGQGGTQGMVIINTGSVTLTRGSETTISKDIYGLSALEAAFDSGNTYLGSSPLPDPLTITNSGAVAVNLQGVQVQGGAAVWGKAQGGDGDESDANNLGGGSSGGVNISNSGAISATLGMQNGYGGIEALAVGGAGQTDSDSGEAGSGGNSGNAIVTNSGSVNLNVTWQNAVSNLGVYGVLAQSVGGAGAESDGEKNAGDGGFGFLASVTLTAGGNVSVVKNGSGPTEAFISPSAGVSAAVVGGAGGLGAGCGTDCGEYVSGGDGGYVSSANITLTDANVTTSGGTLPGLLIFAQGGAGGDGGDPGCNDTNCQSYQNGGVGGAAGPGSGNNAATLQVTAATLPVTISTAGSDSAAVSAIVQGGAGGDGGESKQFGTTQAGYGGAGGNINGASVIQLAGTGQNTVNVTTSGSTSPGISVLSAGGAGGDGGNGQRDGNTAVGGVGGFGGSGGDIAISLASAAITTTGTSSPGIVAASEGGIGGNGGDGDGGLGTGIGGNGGDGGDAGNVTITLDAASSIATQGSGSSGIVAQSFSGAGGSSYDSGGLVSAGGNGGDGGDAGVVFVTSTGAISTTGTAARGILAQSLPGVGGSGGSTGVGFHGDGGTGASGGSAGMVAVVLEGSIVTTGANAQGILAQSIGGSGGAGGQASGVFGAVGGNADTNPFTSDGGMVVIGDGAGSVTTSGISAIGILAQSIGGGGGDGGGASGVAASVGGAGGVGGDGGAVTGLDMDYPVITTKGDFAPALVLQSIGGGGGNAGNASSAAPFSSVAIGGSSGGGGDGGSVTAALQDPSITTVGTKAPGLLLQSIGGGGGTGGNAFAGSIGLGFSISQSYGGTGGTGGDGGAAQAQMSGGIIATGQNPLLVNGQPLGSATGGCTTLPCNTLPVDSYGVLVQSIGGGGGAGGSASAQSLAIAVPVPGTDISVGVAVGTSVGGKGGTAGDGGAVAFSLSDGGKILTSGQGSTGVLAQSIGGGGGVGGDSSSVATVVGYAPYNPDEEEGEGGEGGEGGGANPTSYSLEVTFAMGGNGGGGGAGGAVDVVLGGTVSDCSSDGCQRTADPYGNSTSITTYGDYANGAVAQSIGGGGGNAGFGSSNSQGFSTDNNLSVSVTLGSTGGTGGDGGDVRLYQYAANSVTTYGSGSIGLMAQSVGGGGGTSQGGSYAVGGSTSENDTNLSTEVTVNVGNTGGAGGSGGDVTVSAQAPITTHGGDATAILAQSVGGGGGLGGSAGADASADNPVVQGLDARQAVSNWQSFLEGNSNGSFALNATLSIGGQGGKAGDGGDVFAALYAPIVTTGDWANGIVAQSIGGGGGKGGTAAASGSGGLSYVNVNTDFAIGGTGGTAGDGGSVTVELDQGNQGGSFDNNTSISTAGFGAAGVIAQSIGGGGGMGADGSDSATGTLSVGGTTNGSGGTSGDGGTVVFSYYNPDSTPDPTTVATTGDAADGVILQSIGGGGGAAGSGSSLFAASFQQSGTLSLSAGGSSVSGAGGAVTFAPSDPDTPIVIATTGDDSFGILAQSIGGGGGLVTSQPSSSASPTLKIGGNGGQSNDGGAVSVTLGSQGTIMTAGIGAHGIVAQSVGGGGGVVRLVNGSGDTPTLNTSVPVSLSNGANDGNGGAVNVEVDGTVGVTGAGAIGIFAQSVGSGGGLVMNGNTFYAGSPNFDLTGSSGYGDTVTVTANGTVAATGANGIGIFAQSTGYSNGTNGQVSVTVNGSVTGGSGQPATSSQPGSSAIQVDSPDGSNQGAGNVVTVNSSGSLTTMSGTSGTAIVQTGGGKTNVTNAGTVTGATYLGGGTFTNIESGVHNTGSDAQGNVVNRGVVNIGLPQEHRTTHVTGDFTQTGNGQLGVTIDSLLKAADFLRVDGSAAIDGKIVPTVISLLPGTVPVVSATSLASTADALDSLLFRWDASQSGNTLSITPSSNFKPGGVSLNDSQSSLAGYFGRAWTNSDTAFATRFAELSQINDGSDYKAALDAWSGKAAQAQSIAFANSAGTILGAAMSCPVFIDDTVLLGEDNCAWAKVTGRWTDQSTTSDTQGYYVSGTTYRIGAQHEIAPDWYLGASLGFGQSWATMDGGSSGDGDTYDGSVTVKRVMGPWQFAGSVAFAGGSFNVDRRVDIPGIASETLKSDPSIFLAGGRLRAAYEFAFEDVYIRPYGDLDVVYTDLPGFEEKGDDLYALDVRGSSKASVALSPMVEFGGRLDLDPETTLRAYAAFGISYQPDSTRTIHSSFVGASSANGTFSDQIDSPDVLGRIDVGVQLFRAGGFELKGEYTADIGGSYLSQSASARAAYHF